MGDGAAAVHVAVSTVVNMDDINLGRDEGDSQDPALGAGVAGVAPGVEDTAEAPDSAEDSRGEGEAETGNQHGRENNDVVLLEVVVAPLGCKRYGQ